MWVLEGPFDSIETGVLNFRTAKLVETDKTYTLGRKDTKLVINHKKISKDHCDFIVGSSTDVGDPSARPTVKLFNKRDKVIQVNRRGTEIPVNPSSAFDLENDDEVVVAVGAIVRVTWISVCCYIAPSKAKSNLPLIDCTRLGVNIVHTLDAPITHHLTPQFIANRTLAVSLVSASHFVRQEWLVELVRLGTGSPTSSLEKTFALPPVSKFRPVFSPSLSSTKYKSYSVWDPNEARTNLFDGRRFLFMVDAGQVDPDVRRVVSMGRGDFSTFVAGTGRVLLARQLGKLISQVGGDISRLIVVADMGALKAAIGDGLWAQLEQEVVGLGLQIKTEDDIIHSVLHADLAGLTDGNSQASSSQSSLPSVVPNSIPDEPSLTQPRRRSTRGKAASEEPESVPQPTRSSLKRRGIEESKGGGVSPESEEPPRKKLVRRAPSRQITTPPPEKSETIEIDSDSSPPLPPRKVLRRRAGGRGTTPVIGIDDPSTLLEAEPLITPQSNDMPPPPQPMIDLTAPTQARPHRLKRRAQTQQPETTMSSIEPIVAASEPALGKYKALFDASHPDSQALDTILELDDSQTQAETQSGRREGGGRAVAREEEESQTQTQTQTTTRGKKRSRGVEEDGDIEMVDDLGGSQHPPAKKRTIERDENVPPPAPSKPSSSAQVFNPADRAKSSKSNTIDTDEAFLKAISKKRGKKKGEEILDREFNNLKIARPDLEEENEDDQRRVLEEFGDEGDMRGNFMVVLEMDVPLHRSERRRQDDRSGGDWAGLPNFKKFRKKAAPGEQKRRGVDLLVSEPSDFGTGSAYWQSQGQQGNTQANYQEMPSPVKPTTQANTPHAKRVFVVESDSDENEEVTLDIPLKSPAKKPQTSRAKAKKPPSTTLFLEDSDEVEEVVEPKPVARPSRTSKRSAAKKAAIIVEDSDDETAFKGFGSRKR